MAAALPPIHVTQENVKHHSFSKHDNRHTTQDCGIYLASGLGKKHLLDPARNQQQSDHQNFMHSGYHYGYVSTYASGYKLPDKLPDRRCSSALDFNRSGTHSTTKKDDLHKFRTLSTKDNFRRFPRKYSLPRDLENARPSKSTPWWYNERTVASAGSVKKSDDFMVVDGRNRTDKPGSTENHKHTTSQAATQQPLPQNSS